MNTPTTRAIRAEIERLEGRTHHTAEITGLKKALVAAELGHGTAVKTAIDLVIATIDTWANLRGPRIGCLCDCRDTDGAPCGCSCADSDIEYNISGADAIDAMSGLAGRANFVQYLLELELDGAA